MDVPIDKIKVNNAVVFFFIIVTCAFCPLTLLLDVDYKIFFNYDLIKISIWTKNENI
jgi:Cu/Ag efflux pump CusA